MSSEGFSAFEKHAVICSQRVMLPSSRVDSPLQIVMAVWLGGMWQPAADYNSCLACFFKFFLSMPSGHYYLQRAVTPHQITQQNILQRAEGP